MWRFLEKHYGKVISFLTGVFFGAMVSKLNGKSITSSNILDAFDEGMRVIGGIRRRLFWTWWWI